MRYTENLVFVYQTQGKLEQWGEQDSSFSVNREVSENVVLPESPESLFRMTWGTLWLPTFFTSVWLWLYAGSGFFLRAARRFDIEKKPLQSIGLVAGALVAMGYWAAIIVHRLLA
jgi:hypothetical protein